MPYNHALDIAFEIKGSREKDGTDITPFQIRQAILKRLKNISDEELLEAVGIFDSFHYEEDEEA